MTELLSAKFVTVYKMLSHPMRLEILRRLSVSPLCVNELSRSLNKRQSNVSQHLQILRKNNLVVSKRVGKKQIYEIDRQNVRLIHYLNKY